MSTLRTIGTSDLTRRESGLSAFFRRNRFSTSSTLTNASTETKPPAYSEVDQLEMARDVAGDVTTSLDQPVALSPGLAALAPNRPGRDKEPSYAYPISQEKPWAVLHLKSCLISTSGLPVLVGDKALRGSLVVSSQNAEAIQEIYFTLKGKIQIVSSDVGTEIFFNQRYTVWDKGTGLTPLYSPKDSEDDESSWALERDIEGWRNFSFSVLVPTHLNLATKQAVFRSTADSSPSSAASLPSSFSETGIPVQVRYSMVATIVLGRFRKDGRIKAGMLYIRGEKPPPLLSESRRLAYDIPTQLPKALPGPDIDLIGWDNLPKVTIHGFFEEEGGTCRWIELGFSLSFALPRIYARGAVVPCYLQISCSDEAAPRSLGNPKAPRVRLVRRATYTLPVSDHLRITSWMPPATSGSILPDTVIPEGDKGQVRHEVSAAVWWVSSQVDAKQEGDRCLQGEIHLDKDLQPSTTFSSFSVDYVIEMMTPNILGFKSQSQMTEPLDASKDKGKTQDVIATYPIEILALCRPDEPSHKTFTRCTQARVKQRID